MTQPEALRHADKLDAHEFDEPHGAAAELRRLSAVEAELLAMRRVFSEAGCTFDVNYIRRLVRAEAQRDALLEALKQIEPILARMYGPQAAELPPMQIVRAALAEPTTAQQVVSEQAEDEGLWFVAATASEAYLQQALRRLHAAVEGEDDQDAD